MGKMFILVKDKHQQILKHDTISCRNCLQRIFGINQFFLKFQISSGKQKCWIDQRFGGRERIFVLVLVCSLTTASKIRTAFCQLLL